MHEHVFGQTSADILREVLPAVTEPIVVSPSTDTLVALVSVLDELDDPSVRLLAPESALKDAMTDFLVASVAADLVAAEQLLMRAGDVHAAQHIVAADTVVALVTAGDRAAGLVTDDAAFAESASEHYAARWTGGDTFTLRSPARSQVNETLEAAFSPELAADFDAALTALETVPGEPDDLNEVAISLLVAAKHEALFYDISKWGEDIGLASKATFSRTKTRLEELGLIDTEKVPIDIGRPRLRLELAADTLRDAEAADLATSARASIAAATTPTS